MILHNLLRLSFILSALLYARVTKQILFSVNLSKSNLIDTQRDNKTKTSWKSAMPSFSTSSNDKSFFIFCKFHPSLTFIETFELVLLHAISERRRRMKSPWLINVSGRFNNGFAGRRDVESNHEPFSVLLFLIKMSIIFHSPTT